MKPNNAYIVLISSIVALGGFLMGFDASVISGVIRFVEPEFSLTKLELGWAVSSLTLSATLAMIITGPLSDRWGRKAVLSVSALLYAFSAILSAFAPSFVFLVIARMIGGLGVGASLITAPMYIAEISPPKIRGKMVSFNQLNIVVGISAAFFSNYLILKLGQSEAGWTKALKLDIFNWRWMLGLEALPAIIYFLALFIVPASPRWLIMKGRDMEALKVMQKAGGENFSTAEFENAKQSFLNDAGKTKTPFRAIFKPALRTVLTIGVVLAILQQITGINSVFFYAPMIFGQSGLGVDASFAQAIYLGLTNLGFTVVAMALIDKAGRKPLLIIGVAGIAVSMFILAEGFRSATYTITQETIESLHPEINKENLYPLKDREFLSDIEFKSALTEAVGFPLEDQVESDLLSRSIKLDSRQILVAMLAFVASFAVSVGPVMWVLFSELFPNTVRAVAISFVGFINSLVSFLVQLVFPWELSNLGTAPTFFIYGLFAALGLLFILFKVPETKGKSLESLQAVFIKKAKVSKTFHQNGEN
ncbi:MAG: sugar porter family MFS transporter [Bacteroidales bacterium]|nr:sugar porter family MFS transporter [Bacteroidales bacterium]